MRCLEYERCVEAAAKLLGVATNVDGHDTEEEAANDQDDVDGEGLPQVHHIQILNSTRGGGQQKMILWE